MPYVDSVWSYADRDYQLAGGIDPVRRALERLQRRIEEFLYDVDSENYGDYLFMAWASEQADHDKNASGAIHEAIIGQEFDPDQYLRESSIKREPGENVIAGKRREAVGYASDEARSVQGKTTKSKSSKGSK